MPTEKQRFHVNGSVTICSQQ